MNSGIRIAVWNTGHEIADTVAEAVYEGINNGKKIQSNSAILCRPPENYHNGIGCNIAYGILRGCSEAFYASERFGIPWINIDKGYFRPGHYDGYYRISLRGTQQTIGLGQITPNYERLRALNVEIKPWRGFDHSKPVLAIPPTLAVDTFFKLGAWCEKENWPANVVVRHKGDVNPIHFDDYNYVLTFNSSVGWQALAAGIPCLSDPRHSIIGAWFGDLTTDDLAKKQQNDRERLFGVMATLQLTLDEMRAGKIWDLVSHLISLSDMTAGNPYAPMSPLTA